MRRRLFAYLLVAALASVLLTVGVAAVLSHREARNQVRDTLRRQADAVASTLGLQAPVRSTGALRIFLLRGGQVVEPLGTGRAAGAKTRALRRRARAVATALGDETTAREGTVTLPGGAKLAYVVRDAPGGAFVLARAANPQAGDVRSVGGTLLLAGLGGALLAAVLALVLVGRFTGPIRALTEATGPVAAGAEDVRVPVRGDDELAQLAAAFNAMADDLADARTAERRFLASVSHELRTPLTGVRGYAEALQDGAVDPAQAGALITKESARLERLVADLLDLARSRTPDFVVECTPQDARAVAEGVRARHARAAAERSVALVVVGDGVAPVLADHDRLVQAVSNLVDNAIRLTPPGGRVQIAAQAGRIAILDEGPGLDADDAAHAFEPFWLTRRHGAARAGGAGLGLAIVGGLAAAMGGRATAAPRPEGRGAVFAIELPSGER